MHQNKEISKNWLRVDPIENPIIKDGPKHQPEKFSEYIELKDENDKVIGFLVNEQQYFFDEDGGWRDENGCYYDKEGQPAGWFVLHPGDIYHEHFYDQDGLYVPTDIENDKNSVDDVESDQQEVGENDINNFETS
ncbi:unnamed protein product [Paramecium sonneborni]|uniref:Uncharacterized protein n=1 Tax=Paramecium sonneborni TaxID=65129 RepID=A0A8S1K8U4_9CILI|nr:unnamed protein product [Paramecium sonneborni]